MNLKRYFGDKAFFKSTLLVAIPLMAQQLISNSVNLLDNLMIGQLGDNALASVATVNRYFIIAIFGMQGMIAASSVFLAQFYGSNDEEHMKQSFRFALISTSLIMILFIIIALMFPENIIRFFINDQEVINMGAQYIKVAALSFIPTMITMAISGAMRSVGDSRKPLFAGMISMVTNVFFNYVLIYGHLGMPALGVVGAGIGTLIARIVELGIILYFLVDGDYKFKTPFKDLFDISPTLSKAITLKALPLSLNEVLYASGMAVLMRFYGTRGADVISAYAIAVTVSDLFFTMNAGMSVATTILVSQPLGANKLDEAKENGYKLLGFSTILSVFFGFLLFLTSFIVPHLYDVSANSMYIAQNFLRIMSFLFWIYVLNTTSYFILRAGGDMKSTLIMDSGYMWTVNLVCVGIATHYTDVGILGLYLVGQLTDVVKLGFALKLVHKEEWVVNLAKQERKQEIMELLENEL